MTQQIGIETERNNYEVLGQRMFDLVAELFPICRSITGNGVRQTLGILNRLIPLSIEEVPSGTPVFDWTIPPEWNISDAYIKNERGERVVDFKKNNLHVLNYSAPIRTTLSLNELKKHVFTLPDQPDLIPYRTSYYAERWGFCMSQNQLDDLQPGTYEAVVESSLTQGSLTYAEHVVPGATKDEVLLSAHVCHPSLANDNCSGLALLTTLAQELRRRKTKFTYRFIFAPGTIGAIAWLARNEANVERIKHGLVISCVGDGGGPTYKKSRRGDATIDRALTHLLRHNYPSATIQDFTPYGYDERQYCSPGFNLPVGLLQRSQHGTFQEYHTSGDNLDLVKPRHLADSLKLVMDAIDILENDRTMLNTNPKCEPALGRRGLYATVGGNKDSPSRIMAMLWVLNFSDGQHSLLDIAERAGLEFSVIENAATQLEDAGLLKPIKSPMQCSSPQEPSAASSDRDPISPRLVTAT
jgi:aminopeptidase-like protein